MSNRNKITVFITALILANFTFADFANAQTPTIKELQDLYKAAQTDSAKCTQLGDILNTQLKDLTIGNRIGVTTTYGAQFITPKGFNGTPMPQAAYCATAKYENGVVVAAPDLDQLISLINTASQQTYDKNIKDLSAENLAKNTALKAAKTAALGVANTLAAILSVIVSAITAAILAFVSIAGGFLSAVIDYQSSIYPPDAVDIGWRIVRDLMNMVFILALIVMSIATILRMEKFNYKHLLVKLIIMAILINFSQVIANSLILFANTLINIVKGKDGWLTGYESNFVSIINFYSYEGVGLKEYFLETGGLKDLTLSLTGLILALMMIASYLAIAGLLLIRLVGLWVLVIFSPIAYALNILPWTEKYAMKWWDTFIKYLIWGPVSVFMLWIGSRVLAEGAIKNKVSGQNSIFFFFIIMAFMWGAVLFAKQAGMIGSDLAIKLAKGAVMKPAQFGLRRGIGLAGRKINEASSRILDVGGAKPSLARRAAYAVVNPVGFVRGWQKRSETLSKHAKEIAAARGQEVVERMWTGRTLPYAQFAERQVENEKLKFYIDMKKEQLMAGAVEAENMKGHEGETTRLAIMKAVVANGFTDDLLRMRHFAEKYGQAVTNPDGTQSMLLNSPDTVHRFLNGFIGKGEQAQRFKAEDMEDHGKNTNHPEYLGHAVFNVDENRWDDGMREVGPEFDNGFGHMIKSLENTHQAGYAKGEWRKRTPNQVVTMAPHGMAPIMAKLTRDELGRLQIVTSVDPDGTIHTDGKEIQEAYWGRSDVTPAAKAFYDPMTAMMNDPEVIARFQNVQPRIKDTQLAEQATDDDRLVITNSDELKKVVDYWRDRRALAQTLYAEKIGVERNKANQLGHLKIKYLGNPVNLYGVDYNADSGAVGERTGFIGPDYSSVKVGRQQATGQSPTASGYPQGTILGPDGRPVSSGGGGGGTQGGGGAAPAPAGGGGGGGGSPQVTYVRTATEVIREVGAPNAAHTVIQETSRQFHGGETVDMTRLKNQLNTLGMTVQQVNNALSSMAQRVARVKVDRVDDALYGRVPGVDMLDLKRALHDMIRQRHEQGQGLNETVIINTIRAQSPNVSNNDAAAIAREMMRR
ncbi:MAG: hypothetical protein HY545_00675 [Candidatus Doudnabacteria bacterium]|nr:hypothetical protein [Candidatus Doudnabacteria bacterium]